MDNEPAKRPLELRLSTLIVYNRNVGKADEIAEYYRLRRNIPSSPSRLCGVTAPPGQYAHRRDVEFVRKQILVDCLCQLVPATSRPAGCDLQKQTYAEVDVDALAVAMGDVSPISHIAFIRGLPHRYKELAERDPMSDEPSFDAAIALSLYSAVGVRGSFFDTDENYPDGLSALNIEQHGLYPPLDPRKHRIAAYGRVEAMTTDRTMALIDRTIKAEQDGLQGNIISEGFRITGVPGNQGAELTTVTELRDLGGGHGPECTSYLAGMSTDLWPYQSCRFGSTRSGRVPGDMRPEHGLSQAIPVAVNAGLFMGDIAGDARIMTNLQEAFNGKPEHLLAWRINDHCQEVLCKTAGCRAQSTDFFRELDTRCVGVAPGFVGYQHRSYPVQFYGFYPSGWHGDKNNDGADERTPPVIVDSGGAPHGTDSKFARFALPGAEALPECKTLDGTLIACPAPIPVLMGTDAALGAGHTFSRDFSKPTNITVKFFHRHPAQAAGADLNIRLNFIDRYGGRLNYPVTQARVAFEKPVGLGSRATSGWTSATVNFVVVRSSSDAPAGTGIHVIPDDPAAADIRQIEMTFVSAMPVSSVNGKAPLSGYLDIDNVQVLFNGENILDPVVGHFSNGWLNGKTLPDGAWASHAIDRLGAVAWWGSSAHLHLGDTLNNIPRFLRGYIGGRTLGEAILLAGKTSGGLVFGDPLYQPIDLAIYLSDGRFFDEASNSYVVDQSLYSRAHARVRINTVLNKKATQDVYWNVEVCRANTLDPGTCDPANWHPLARGTGKVQSHVIYNDSLLALAGQNEKLMMRLTAWQAGREHEKSRRYLRIKLLPQPTSFFRFNAISPDGRLVDFGSRGVPAKGGFVTPGAGALVNFDNSGLRFPGRGSVLIGPGVGSIVTKNTNLYAGNLHINMWIRPERGIKEGAKLFSINGVAEKQVTRFISGAFHSQNGRAHIRIDCANPSGSLDLPIEIDQWSQLNLYFDGLKLFGQSSPGGKYCPRCVVDIPAFKPGITGMTLGDSGIQGEPAWKGGVDELVIENTHAEPSLLYKRIIPWLQERTPDVEVVK